MELSIKSRFAKCRGCSAGRGMATMGGNGNRNRGPSPIGARAFHGSTIRQWHFAHPLSKTTTMTNDLSQDFPPILPSEGWHVLHLFYLVNHGAWSELDEDRRREGLARLTELVGEANGTPSTQLLTFAMMTPRADLAFMMLTPNLHTAQELEKRLTQSLGPDVLEPVFSFLSLTERSEYTTTEEEYAISLKTDPGLAAGSVEFNEAMDVFRQRMAKYGKDRLYPNMPDWQVFCFYPMTKRRLTGQNWYALDHARRKELMAGHARIGRQWAGKVRQLITGCTGLDDDEWGVTLFAHTTSDIKDIVHQMRFDAVSAEYAEFGQFYIGVQLPLAAIFRRLLLLNR